MHTDSYVYHKMVRQVRPAFSRQPHAHPARDGSFECHAVDKRVAHDRVRAAACCFSKPDETGAPLTRRRKC
jgi:hypothetical protein